MKQTPLLRRTPLKRGPWRKRKADSELARSFARYVIARDGACILAGRHVCEGRLDAAHVIPKGTLRKRGFSELVVYDPRNGVAACRRAHSRSDLGVERFPRAFIPLRAVDFAAELGLSHLIDRLYGEASRDV